jgi:hypothetical protein
MLLLAVLLLLLLLLLPLAKLSGGRYSVYLPSADDGLEKKGSSSIRQTPILRPIIVFTATISIFSPRL